MVDGTPTLLSANIKRLREESGQSQKALAELSGVPRPTIAHLEAGQANPTLAVVLKVAAALGVRVDDLVQPEEALVVVLGVRALTAPGMLRDPKIERIVIKAASRINFEATVHAPALIWSERGDFTLVSGDTEYPLPVEAVARIRTNCDGVTQNGAVLYLATSR
jgi:transcriptional regulator with XRE-family HTH domain